MAFNNSILKDANWLSLLVQLTVISLLSVVWYLLDTGNPILNGALSYYVLSLCLRTLIPHNHRKGMSLINQEKFLEAIPYFEKSYAFFDRFKWIDKYRYLTLLSSSKLSYREMALNNIVFCYGEAGDWIKSREYYRRITGAPSLGEQMEETFDSVDTTE